MDNSSTLGQHHLSLLSKIFYGFLMGTANIIPGVSGGTIALMLGIYEPLINTLKCFDKKFLTFLKTLKFKSALAHVQATFLIPLLIGVFIAIFSLSHILPHLLDHYPIWVYSFFFGLILASVPVIGKHVRPWNPLTVFLGLLTTALMYVIIGMVPVKTPESYWFLFISGALAICTMILPGISGSFVLVLIGKYQFILEAIKNYDFLSLSAVALGCIVGLLSFVRVLNWFLTKYPNQTMAVLTGLVLGSVRKIWPWKKTVQAMMTTEGQIIPVSQINIFPGKWNGEVGFAIFFIFLGFVCAFLLNRLSKDKIS